MIRQQSNGFYFDFSIRIDRGWIGNLMGENHQTDLELFLAFIKINFKLNLLCY